MLRQTYDNLEIIVIDDGSTDHTSSIVEAIGATDPRIRLICEPNGGVAKARNLGIREASGDFVAFLDADDLWHPNKIELQVAVLNAVPEAVAVYGMSRLIDKQDRVFGNGTVRGSDGYTLGYHLYALPVGNGSSLLVRREIALAVGGFEPAWNARGIGGCEDLDFELKVVAKYRILFLPKYLVGYRVYPGNMSSDKRRMSQALVSTVEHHIRVNPDLSSYVIQKAKASVLEHSLYYLVTGRYFLLAAPVVLRLLRADFGRGLRVLTRLLKQTVARFIRVGSIRKDDPLQRPFFYDLKPDFGVDLCAQRACDKKILRRIKELDCRMEETAATSVDHRSAADMQ